MKKAALKFFSKIFQVLLLLFLFLLNVGNVYADVLFQDDFEQGLKSDWQKINTSGPQTEHLWELSDGKYGIRINTSSTIAETVINKPEWSDYIFEFDMVGVLGTDKNFAFRWTNNPLGENLSYEVHHTGGYIYMGKPGPPDSKFDPNLPIIWPLPIQYPIYNNQAYHWKLIVEETHIQVFITNENDETTKLFDFEDNNLPRLNGGIGLRVGTGAVYPTQVWFDNVKVTTLDHVEEPEENPPVVVLPGLGGSWNTTALVTGGAGGTWKKVPFVKVYDNLKSTFIDNADYTEGGDYFEFYYDWRKPLDELADELKDYLETTVLDGKPPETKVNLIGHSMGGMVARAYGQKYLGEDKINNLVTIGSPHEGAIKAWQGWAGAETGNRWSWQWIVLQLYLHINKVKYASPVEAVHGLTPGLKDLTPIFDFAKDQNNEEIDVTTMDSFNAYLAELKVNLTEDLRNLLNTIAGHDPNEDTVEWVKLDERSLADQILGKWPDGKPVAYEYTSEGDLTVLDKSALIDGADQTVVDNNHTKLVQTSEGIEAILNALEIEAIPAAAVSTPSRNPSLLFFLHSPADIRVTAPDNSQAGEGVSSPMPNAIYSAEDDLLLIYNAQDGHYQVEVIGIENGDYQLNLGQLTESGEIWNTFSGTTNNNEIDTYSINFNPESPEDLPLIDETGKRKLEIVIEQLENLKNHINGQLLEQNYKDQLINYINRLLRIANKGLDYLETGNYSRGSRYVKGTMTGVYLLRIRNNNWVSSNNIAEEHQAYVNNQVEEIGKLALDSFVSVFNKSGEMMAEKKVLREFKKTNRLRDRLMEKLQSFSGENYFLGNAFGLLEEKSEKSQTAFEDDDFVASYAYTLVSRLLSLEALRLIK